MTIISRPAPPAAPVCAPSPGQRAVTRPGTASRVGPAAATGHTHGGHSIACMDHQLALFTESGLPQPAETRPWIYERVLAQVVAGRVWTDNQRRRWLYTGGETTGDRMPTDQQQVLAELQRAALVRVTPDKVDMDVNDGRTLRVRRYEPTDEGTGLHTRWAGLSPYTA